MDKTIRRAKDLYFWHGLSSEVKSLVHGCEVCRPFLASQPQQPLIPGTSATGPMTDVGSDLFQIGHNHYLVMVDRYSGCPFVENLAKLSTSAIIKVLTSWFNTFGGLNVSGRTMVRSSGQNSMNSVPKTLFSMKTLALPILKAMV